MRAVLRRMLLFLPRVAFMGLETVRGDFMFALVAFFLLLFRFVMLAMTLVDLRLTLLRVVLRVRDGMAILNFFSQLRILVGVTLHFLQNMVKVQPVCWAFIQFMQHWRRCASVNVRRFVAIFRFFCMPLPFKKECVSTRD